MSGETDPEIPQDPGIPGSKTPQELPPQDEPEIEHVPDSGEPEVDDEGHMAPPTTREGSAGATVPDRDAPA
jgi:hypothetical protein